MNQTDLFQSAFDIICQLHLDQKTVSVATIRNAMTQKLPLPIITKALAHFKENPSQYLDIYQQKNKSLAEQDDSVNATLTSSSTAALTDSANTATDTLKQLTLRVEQLERQVAQLTERLTE